MGLDCNFLAEDQFRSRLPGSFALGLAFLWAVDPTEADAFGLLIVQDFDGVTVYDPNYLAFILRDSGSRRGRQEN